MGECVYIIDEIVKYNPETHELMVIHKDEVPLVLSVPASRCFLFLLLNQGRIITQSELFHEGWEKYGIDVSMQTLYQNIYIIRRALKIAGIDREVISTIPKKGIMIPDSINVVSIVVKKESLKTTDDVSAFNHIFYKKYIIIPALIFPSIIVLFVYFFLFYQSYDRFEKYIFQDEYSGCKLYDKVNDSKNHDKLISFFRKNKISCDVYKHIYVGYYKDYSNVVMLRCDKMIKSNNLDSVSCKSDIYYD